MTKYSLTIFYDILYELTAFSYMFRLFGAESCKFIKYIIKKVVLGCYFYIVQLIKSGSCTAAI
jgi:hypothetical protein